MSDAPATREDDLFLAAIEIDDPARRNRFLDRVCRDDAALRRRLDDLLRHHDDAGSFLETPAVESHRTVLGESPLRDRFEPSEERTMEDELSFLESTDDPKLLGRLGKYEVLSVVGRGGLGVVLKARDPELDRIVAIKVPVSELAVNVLARRRFRREAQAAAAVGHDHVVTIYAVGEERGLPYLVMEYVAGRSLQERIDAEGPLELKEILRIGVQTARGLAAAHEQGLVHRDVKPANILLENGVQRVKLTDFGLARAVDDVSITQTGTVAGTPQYMSPEQAMGRAVDHRSDLFALGSVLYAMCTGRAAFRAESAIAVLKRVCEDDPKPIRRTNPEIPEWLCGVVEKLLAKDAAERFASADDVAELLNGYLAHLQEPETIAAPPAVAVLRSGRNVLRTEASIEHDLSAVTTVLTSFGLGSLLCFVVAVAGADMMRNPNPFEVWFFLGGLVSFPLGVFLLYAAWQCHQRESLSTVRLAVSAALVPFNLVCVLGLAFSLWASRTLRREDVAAEFAEPPPAPHGEPLPWSRWWAWTSRFGWIAAFIGFVATMAGNVLDDELALLGWAALVVLYAAIGWVYRRVPLRSGWGPMVLTLTITSIAFNVPFFGFGGWMRSHTDDIAFCTMMLYFGAVVVDSLFVAAYQTLWPLAPNVPDAPPAGAGATPESDVDRHLRHLERVLRTVGAVWSTLFVIAALLMLLLLLVEKPGIEDQFSILVVGLAAIATMACGVVATHGARHVAARGSYGWAYAGGIASMLPVNPLALLALPITTWAFSALTLPETRRAFGRSPGSSDDESDEDADGEDKGRAVWKDLALFVGFAFGIAIVAEFSGQTNYTESWRQYVRNQATVSLADLENGSTIVLNDSRPTRVVGSHREFPIQLPAGRYAVEVRAPGRTTRTNVLLRAGERTRLDLGDGVQHVWIDGPR